MSITKVLRNKLNVYVVVGILFLGRNELPFREVFSIRGLEIVSFEIYYLI